MLNLKKCIKIQILNRLEVCRFGPLQVWLAFHGPLDKFVVNPLLNPKNKVIVVEMPPGKFVAMSPLPRYVVSMPPCFLLPKLHAV